MINILYEDSEREWRVWEDDIFIIGTGQTRLDAIHDARKELRDMLAELRQIQHRPDFREKNSADTLKI